MVFADTSKHQISIEALSILTAEMFECIAVGGIFIYWTFITRRITATSFLSTFICFHCVLPSVLSLGFVFQIWIIRILQ